MPGMNCWRSLTKTLSTIFLITILVLSSVITQPAMALGKARPPRPEKDKPAAQFSTALAEAPPPAAIQELRKSLEKYQPQVTIVSPKPNEILTDNRVSVRFQVKDLPIFKDEKLGLGPHLHVLLDNDSYQAVYDLSKPLVFDELKPGTHTIRAFASRPWHESFKNEGSYAQVSFHVFTKTQENSPNPVLPLLTYSRPQGTYGAEPIMLDFYLTNAPLHLVAQEDPEDDIADWRIRCTVNGESFLLERWQPVYLKGFKPGKNWVQLEFLDERGNPVNNVFNNTARVITYEPGGKDTLSRLIRGELSSAAARGIVDPDYVPEEPAPSPSPIPAPTPTPGTPVQIVPPVPPAPTSAPEVKALPTSKPIPSPVPAEKSKTEASKAQKPSSMPVTPSPETTPSGQIKVLEQPKTPEKLEVPEKLATPKPAEPQKASEPLGTPKPEIPRTETSETKISEPEAPKSQKPESEKPAETSGFSSFLNRFRLPSKAAKPSPPPVSLPPRPVTPSPGSTPAEVRPPVQPSPVVKESPKPQPSKTPESASGTKETPVKPLVESPKPQVTGGPKPTASPTKPVAEPPVESPKASPKPQPSKSPEPAASPTATPVKPLAEPDSKGAKPKMVPSFLNRLRPSPSPVAPAESGKPAQSPPSDTKSAQPQPVRTPEPAGSPPTLPAQPSVTPSPVLPSPVVPSAKSPAQPAPVSTPPVLNRSLPSPSPTASPSPVPAKAIAPPTPARSIPPFPAPSPRVQPTGTDSQPNPTVAPSPSTAPSVVETTP